VKSEIFAESHREVGPRPMQRSMLSHTWLTMRVQSKSYAVLLRKRY